MGQERSPGEVNGNPLQYSCLGNPTEGLAGYSPWSAEWDTTEHTTPYMPLILLLVDQEGKGPAMNCHLGPFTFTLSGLYPRPTKEGVIPSALCESLL